MSKLTLSIILTVALFSCFGNGTPTKRAEEAYRFKSLFDDKYATVTDKVYSPGPYTTYAVNTTELSDAGQQKWTIYGQWTGEPGYDSNELYSLEGTRMNIITTYKPCESCFAANNYWYFVHEDDKPNVIKLFERWTDLCLQNPGNGSFLEKVNCTTEVVKENILWEIVKVE